MVYSATTTKDGILQMIEQTTGQGDASITGNVTQFAYFNNLINQWYRTLAYYAWKVDGNWKFDDANQTTLNTATTDLVDGQRDYTLSVTAMKIRQVEVMGTSGKYYTLQYMSERDFRLKYEKEQETASVPSNYRLVGNSVILYPAPKASDVTITSGLRLTLDRDVVPFLVSDTTKVPGIAVHFHSVLYYGPCFEWSTVKGISNVSTLCNRMLGNFSGLIEMFTDFYSRRNQDEVPVLSPVRRRMK